MGLLGVNNATRKPRVNPLTLAFRTFVERGHLTSSVRAATAHTITKVHMQLLHGECAVAPDLTERKLHAFQVQLSGFHHGQLRLRLEKVEIVLVTD